MSRINASLVLILAFSSICFGATLMQQSMKKSANITHINHINHTENAFHVEPNCRKLLNEHQETVIKKIAEDLYEKAFKLGFDGDIPAAKAASKCAAYLINGSDHWDIEARDLIH